MSYIDGFLLPIPTNNLADYKKLAKLAAKVFKEYGALEYREYIGDDFSVEMGIPFPTRAKVKEGETLVFAWIVYKSKAHRNSVNKKVMKDPRMAVMDPMPFNPKRMSYGGFKGLVEV